MTRCEPFTPILPLTVHSINEEANAWTQRGIALLQAANQQDLTQSIGCFDRALRLRLPILEIGGPWIRYGFCAGWMNRADALTRLGGTSELETAVASYDLALQHLQKLPMEMAPEFPRRLAIAWCNRGLTLQQAGRHPEAISSFENAITSLKEEHSCNLQDRQHLAAGAWLNLGISACALRDPAKAGESAKKALAALSDEINDLLQFEIGLKARHLLCQAYSSMEPGSLNYDRISEATDAVEEGLRISGLWETRGTLQFQALSRELFHFGCRIYQIYQPQFVSEFVQDNFRESGMKHAAQEALWQSLAQLHRSGFPIPGSQHFAELKSKLHDLVAAEQKINIALT